MWILIWRFFIEFMSLNLIRENCFILWVDKRRVWFMFLLFGMYGILGWIGVLSYDCRVERIVIDIG